MISFFTTHSADSTSQHNSLWKWILMPQSYYNRGGQRKSGLYTTKYPYSSTMQFPFNNGYQSSFNPYNWKSNRNAYYNR